MKPAVVCNVGLSQNVLCVEHNRTVLFSLSFPSHCETVPSLKDGHGAVALCFYVLKKTQAPRVDKGRLVEVKLLKSENLKLSELA